MLATVYLGRLTEHNRTALANDLIGRHPERRVRRHARPAVGATTLEGDHQLRRVHPFASGFVGDGQQALYGLDALPDRLAESPEILDGADRSSGRRVDVAGPQHL